MTRLFKYLSKSVLTTIALVTLVVVGLELFILFVSQVDEIGRGDYSLLSVMWYVLGNLPLRVYTLFPLTALVGALLGLGLLASNSELIVMQACGISISRITLMVMTIALGLVMLVSAVGETLGPALSHNVDAMKTRLLNQGQAMRTVHGTWVRNNHRFIRIDRVAGKHLFGVTIYHFDGKHRLLDASRAANVDYEHHHWVLKKVARSQLLADHITVKKFASLPAQFHLNPRMLGAEKIEPEQMNLVKLHRFIQYRRKNGLDFASYLLVFWQRLFQPLATAVMMFLAIPFIFGPLRSATMGYRIIVGVMVGFGFYLFNQFIGPASLVYQIPPVIAALAPTLLFAGVGGYLMFKMKRN